MAKVFRTEKVNLAGNIRLEASDSGEFEIKNSTGTQTLLSRAGIDSDVSSLKAQDIVHDSDVSSLDAAIEEQDVVALKVANGGSAIASGSMGSTSETVTINFGRTFSSAPVVLGFLNSTGASDPIIPVMITAVSTTQATATFGDVLPSNDYTLELFASVSG